jgi:hypothetical protein
MQRMTDYFRNDVLEKRPYIRLEWCVAALQNPVRREVQSEDGRFAIGCMFRNLGDSCAWSRYQMV